MFTYGAWKIFTEFERDTTNYEKMFTYTISVFISLFTIWIDVVTAPFQLLGLLILKLEKWRNKK